jgi:hypothetical protein
MSSKKASDPEKQEAACEDALHEKKKPNEPTFEI